MLKCMFTVFVSVCVLLTACAGNQGGKRPGKKPAPPEKQKNTSSRIWKPGASPCLGFKPDGSAAFVLLSSSTGDNLSLTGSHVVERLDFSTLKSKVALVVADESDCQLEPERCEEYGIATSGNGEGDAQSRAAEKLAAAGPVITGLIRREGLVACAVAREDDGLPSRKRWLLGTKTAEAALVSVPSGKVDEEGNEPARRVGVLAGKKTHHAFTLDADKPDELRTIHAVYYLPGKNRVVVVVQTDEHGTVQRAQAVRYPR